MSQKRTASDLSDEDTDGSERGAKRQKILPHLGKVDKVMADFLDFLSPATSISLAQFNEGERAEKRRGVTPINISTLEMDLQELRTINEIEVMEAKLSDIDLYFKDLEAQYNKYIADATAKGDNVTVLVRPALRPAVSVIQKAREQLPGMFLIR
jgi:hypothetical protein